MWMRSGQAPAFSKAKCVSPSQLAPGARRMRTRGEAMKKPVFMLQSPRRYVLVVFAECGRATERKRGKCSPASRPIENGSKGACCQVGTEPDFFARTP